MSKDLRLHSLIVHNNWSKIFALSIWIQQLYSFSWEKKMHQFENLLNKGVMEGQIILCEQLLEICLKPEYRQDLKFKLSYLDDWVKRKALNQSKCVVVLQILLPKVYLTCFYKSSRLFFILVSFCQLSSTKLPGFIIPLPLLHFKTIFLHVFCCCCHESC